MSTRPETRADILIVDDTVENLHLLGSMLREQGYGVRPVPRGKLALDAAISRPPDLVLLDINMPGMNGYEVCQELKARSETRDIPVIFISALNEVVDKVKAFDVGGVDYVTKPFQVEEVHSRVQAHLELRSLRREVERKNARLEASLARQQELEQVKERLVQMIVHDLKNPLTAIIGNSEFLREVLEADTDASEALGDVTDSAQSMHRMVLNILDVMRLQDTDLHPRLTSVDLHRLVETAAHTLRPAALRSGHTIEVEAHAELPPVPLDRDLIQRVLENLLENAVKYAPGETAVTIAIDAPSAGEFVISVADQGPGVPEDCRDQVFEPFARLERDAATDLRQSRGLGLAYCKMAVEAHGGHIHIDDNSSGGAVFRIHLPSAPAATNPEEVNR